MSREAAKKLLSIVLRHAAEQDVALVELQKICSEDEFNQYKKMVGKSMGAMLLEIINPIVAKYPDLKPPELL
jgi:hypothetical protein